MACQPDIRFRVHVGDVAVYFKGKLVIAVWLVQFGRQTGLIAQESINPALADGTKERALRGTAAAEKKVVIQLVIVRGIVTGCCKESIFAKREHKTRGG